MKLKHTKAKKANRGKKSDAPNEGLTISRMKVPLHDKTNQMVMRDYIQGHTLVRPRNGKPAFLRRNSLIKK